MKNFIIIKYGVILFRENDKIYLEKFYQLSKFYCSTENV